MEIVLVVAAAIVWTSKDRVWIIKSAKVMVGAPRAHHHLVMAPIRILGKFRYPKPTKANPSTQIQMKPNEKPQPQISTTETSHTNPNETTNLRCDRGRRKQRRTRRRSSSGEARAVSRESNGGKRQAVAAKLEQRDWGGAAAAPTASEREFATLG